MIEEVFEQVYFGYIPVITSNNLHICLILGPSVNPVSFFLLHASPSPVVDVRSRSTFLTHLILAFDWITRRGRRSYSLDEVSVLCRLFALRKQRRSFCYDACLFFPRTVLCFFFGETSDLMRCDGKNEKQ